VVMGDQCGLNSICWLWMRFVMDCSYRGGGGRDRGSSVLPLVRMSQRRLLPGDYVQLHEVITEDITGIDGWYTIKNDDDDDDDRTLLWNKLTTLLPHIARAVAAHFNDNNDTNNNNHHLATNLTTSVVQFRWPLLHTASFLDCSRAIVAMAAQQSSYQEDYSTSNDTITSSIREKDAHRIFPIHYAASRAGYTRHNLPLVCGTTTATTTSTSSSSLESIVERSVVFDLVSLWPRGARVTNGRGRLPLHIAIDEEKQSRSSSRLHEGGSSSLMSPRHPPHPHHRRRSLRQMEASWSTFSAAVLCLFDSYPEGLERRDGVTKLYPSMQAAVGDDASLDMVFVLLMKNPTIVK